MSRVLGVNLNDEGFGMVFSKHEHDDLPETYNEFIEFINKHDLEIECWEGSLIDNYLVYLNEELAEEYGGHTLILSETYLNEWSSYYKPIVTSDYKVVDEYVARWSEGMEEEQ